ncbi:MAG: ATP-binding protein, partial [Chlorobi bacterium]|nr:ATP-binding protein [Chlorobiota bacterium]
GSGSTGSGLHISKIILEKYNGRIYVKETEPEKGTTIAIELNEGM